MVGKMKEFWGGYREPLPQGKGGTLRLKVMPAAWEIHRGYLRRTPSLKRLERDGVIAGRGWTLRPLGEDWYDASEFYERLGLRETPLPLLFVAEEDGSVWVEVLPLSASRRLPPREPKEAPKEGGEAPKGQEEVAEERPKKRVRIGFPSEEPSRGAAPSASKAPPQPGVGWGSAPAPQGAGGLDGAPGPTGRFRREEGGTPSSPSPEEAYALLWEILGGEEFSRYSVDPYLRHRGFDPEAVWEALSRRGLLLEERGFFRLRPKAPSPVRRSAIEDTEGLPSYLRPAR